jgi:hypothetical protein
MEILVFTGIRVLEILFVIGWIGSLLVLLLSGIEDTRMLLEKDEPAPQADAHE